MTVESGFIIIPIIVQVSELEPGKWNNMPKLPRSAMIEPGGNSVSRIIM